MGFTCILYTNIVLHGRYGTLKLAKDLKSYPIGDCFDRTDPYPNNKILDWSKLKEFLDENKTCL